jgi:hypothetical protein
LAYNNKSGDLKDGDLYMKQYRIFTPFQIIWIPLVFIILLSGCGYMGIFSQATPMTPTSLIIYRNTNPDIFGENSTLSIASGNFYYEKYTTESGKEEYGLTAVLWMWIKERPETQTSIGIHTGQIILFEGYRIEVLRIARDSLELFAEVEITEME